MRLADATHNAAFADGGVAGPYCQTAGEVAYVEDVVLADIGAFPDTISRAQACAGASPTSRIGMRAASTWLPRITENRNAGKRRRAQAAIRGDSRKSWPGGGGVVRFMPCAPVARAARAEPRRSRGMQGG